MSEAFVIQTHSGYGPLHYDLMLESAGALATWRLPGPPTCLTEGQEMPALRLPDHRLAYLTYEGPVRRGRGSVSILDKGTYQLLAADDNRWEILAAGSAFKGRFELRRDAPGGGEWRLRRLSEE